MLLGLLRDKTEIQVVVKYYITSLDLLDVLLVFVPKGVHSFMVVVMILVTLIIMRIRLIIYLLFIDEKFLFATHLFAWSSNAGI
jgi:hypothetical protein